MALPALGLGLPALRTAVTGRSIDTVGRIAFTHRVQAPPLAESRFDGEGRRVFELDIRQGTREFIAGRRSPAWGVNGECPGPTLRAARGETVLIDVANGVDEATSLHWHGMHLPPTMDGGPHRMIEPGATWSPTWRIDQPGASLWYHPHPHGKTAQHLYRGVAGMFLIDDDDTTAKSLPHRYGIDDVPVIVQDRRFVDGRLEEAARI